MSIIDNTNLTLTDKITTINFNQNSTCVCIGINKGFKIFNTHPFREHIERNLDAELYRIELYNRSNLIAFISNDTSHKYGSNKVIIWDDYQTKVLLEIRFSEKVVNTKIKKDILYIILETQIHLFNFSLMSNLMTLPTYFNRFGCFSISNDLLYDVISYPESSVGYIIIKNMTIKQAFLVCAHDHEISYIKVSYKGEFVATSSVQGTMIRIFDTSNGVILQELRRGGESARIYNIVFSFDCKYIACSSNRNTIHIFSLRSSYLKKNELNFREEHSKYSTIHRKSLVNKEEDSQMKEKLIIIEDQIDYYKTLPKNNRSFLFNLTSLIPLPKYFSEEWSFSKLRIPNMNSSYHKIAFSMSNDIYVFIEDGRFIHAKFNSDSDEECEVVFENNIFFKS